jgi:hypothetical protein
VAAGATCEQCIDAIRSPHPLHRPCTAIAEQLPARRPPIPVRSSAAERYGLHGIDATQQKYMILLGTCPETMFQQVCGHGCLLFCTVQRLLTSAFTKCVARRMPVGVSVCPQVGIMLLTVPVLVLIVVIVRSEAVRLAAVHWWWLLIDGHLVLRRQLLALRYDANTICWC